MCIGVMCKAGISDLRATQQQSPPPSLHVTCTQVHSDESQTPHRCTTQVHDASCCQVEQTDNPLCSCQRQLLPQPRPRPRHDTKQPRCWQSLLRLPALQQPPAVLRLPPPPCPDQPLLRGLLSAPVSPPPPVQHRPAERQRWTAPWLSTARRLPAGCTRSPPDTPVACDTLPKPRWCS